MPAEPWSSIATVIDNYFKQGLYVTALGIAAAGNEVLYSTVFRPGSGAEWVVSAQPWSQFAITVGNYFKQGLYVAAMAATIQNGVVPYSAAFRPDSGAEWVVSAQPWSQFATTVNNYFKQGLYVTGIAVVESSNGPLYTAVFRPGPGGAEWVIGNYMWKVSPSRPTLISPRASTRPASPPADLRSSTTSDQPPAQPEKRPSLRVARSRVSMLLGTMFSSGIGRRVVTPASGRLRPVSIAEMAPVPLFPARGRLRRDDEEAGGGRRLAGAGP